MEASFLNINIKVEMRGVSSLCDVVSATFLPAPEAFHAKTGPMQDRGEVLLLRYSLGAIGYS